MGSAVETSTPSPKGAPSQKGTPSQAATATNDPFDHELRYLLSRGEMRRFLDAIAARAAIEIYDPQRPISYTRTTYLDTNDLAYFRTGDGAPARRLRIREYALAATAKDAPVLSGTAFVELKQHDGPARSKVRFAASPAEIARLLGHREAGPSRTMTAAQAEIARELALPTMAPRLGTWYRRLCLTAEGRRVRITLDENLTFCQPQPIGEAGALAAPREREVVAAFPARVLEIKHCGEMPFWLGPALESLQPAESFSKFRMGMTALGHGTEARKEADGLAPAATESPLFALASFVAA
jgi:hypothetical protein